MAVVSDPFVSAFTRTPIIKLPDPVRMFTAQPRAIANFNVQGGVLSAKPLNDQQNVIIAIDLPIQFAYRMIEMNVHFQQDVAGDWDPACLLDVVNGIRNLGGFGRRQLHPGIWVNTIRRNTQGIMAIDFPVPRYIMQAIAPSTAPTITFEASNNTAAAALAGTVDFLATFYEYEIEQVQMYPVHYPTLTLERS